MKKNPIYLDCNATTPVEAQVLEEMRHYLDEEFGNAGSRTHIYGTEAARAVNRSREQLAALLSCEPADVIFTSGATESNNSAILGLAKHGRETGRNHIITTAIEHKAVLEPIAYLESMGFQVTRVRALEDGSVAATQVLHEVKAETLLVSVMQVNNETGVIQPIEEITSGLKNTEVFFHTDAAQGFGKANEPLRDARIDMISVSGHKIYAPKGIGALVLKKRKYKRPPLQPILFGGGQERGLRPGTLPVHLIVALGKAAELALEHNAERASKCFEFKRALIDGLAPLRPEMNGNQDKALPSVINLSIPGVDSEAAILALKELVAISNGSACTSAGSEPSHVLSAMGLSAERIRGALRFSWCHVTEVPDWNKVVDALRSYL